MKISRLGEFGLIEKIRKMTSQRSSSVMTGIGDDSAVLKVSASASLLATTDMLVEGVHFDLAYFDFYSLGWKSAAVNLSDIAAMGGVPRFCLSSLCIPPTLTVEQVAHFYRGFNAVLRAHRTTLVGGDTCSSRLGFMVSVTVLGEVRKELALTRGGAKPGDRIFVTGALGDSAAGLEVLKKRVTRLGEEVVTEAAKRLIEKHLRPIPRVTWGRKIALSQGAHAMIDISDGLSSDLGHICEQSHVGALISAEKIPLSPSLQKVAPYLDAVPLEYALSGGEDYELLFTAPLEKARKLRSLGIPLYEIGEITRTRTMLTVDGRGKKSPLSARGYDHFINKSVNKRLCKS